MKSFQAQSVDGKLKISRTLSQHVLSHPKMRYDVTPVLPESREMRGFYHGAVCALFCHLQEHLDHHKAEDVAWAHEWFKMHLNADLRIIDGKPEIIGKTTKGKLSDHIEKCIEMLEDDYGVNRQECLDPSKYKDWRDRIFPDGGPRTYIDYLVSIGKL